MLLHPSVASHGSTCPGAQVRSGAPYPGAPQYKELGVNGRRDCVPCAELWERSALAPSEGLPFPLANINHSRQCVWQEALVFVGFSFFFFCWYLSGSHCIVVSHGSGAHSPRKLSICLPCPAVGR